MTSTIVALPFDAKVYHIGNADGGPSHTNHQQISTASTNFIKVDRWK